MAIVNPAVKLVASARSSRLPELAPDDLERMLDLGPDAFESVFQVRGICPPSRIARNSGRIN